MEPGYTWFANIKNRNNFPTPKNYFPVPVSVFQETVEVFLSRTSVTDEPDLEGRTAFMWAAGKGADQVISAFIKHNVEIQQQDNNGGTGKNEIVCALWLTNFIYIYTIYYVDIVIGNMTVYCVV